MSHVCYGRENAKSWTRVAACGPLRQNVATNPLHGASRASAILPTLRPIRFHALADGCLLGCSERPASSLGLLVAASWHHAQLGKRATNLRGLSNEFSKPHDRAAFREAGHQVGGAWHIAHFISAAGARRSALGDLAWCANKPRFRGCVIAGTRCGRTGLVLTEFSA